MSFSCNKDFSKAYLFGVGNGIHPAFNVTATNFKLNPRLNPKTNILPGSENHPNQPVVKHPSLYSNTTWKMTRKEQLKLLLKLGNRMR